MAEKHNRITNTALSKTFFINTLKRFVKIMKTHLYVE